MKTEISKILCRYTRTEIFKNSFINLSRKNLVKPKTLVSLYFSAF